MVSFAVNSLFVLDLRDDFLMNNDSKLYEFLGKDPVKAFHLGIRVSKWFDLLDKKQQYLHSKSLRHNSEDVKKYVDQITYWAKKFPEPSDDGNVNTIMLSEYVFNNLIWDEDEEIDKVKVALFLGMIVGKDSSLSDEELIFSIH